MMIGFKFFHNENDEIHLYYFLIIAIFRNKQDRFTKPETTGASSTKKEKKRTNFPLQKLMKTKNSRDGMQGRYKKTKMIATQQRRR